MRPWPALTLWGISCEGYKDFDARAKERRDEMISVIERAGPAEWLRWDDDTKARCAETDHALDALVCALVARAAMLGLVEPVPVDVAPAARVEGWIALPRAGSLRALASAL